MKKKNKIQEEDNSIRLPLLKEKIDKLYQSEEEEIFLFAKINEENKPKEGEEDTIGDKKCATKYKLGLLKFYLEEQIKFQRSYLQKVQEVHCSSEYEILKQLLMESDDQDKIFQLMEEEEDILETSKTEEDDKDEKKEENDEKNKNGEEKTIKQKKSSKKIEKKSTKRAPTQEDILKMKVTLLEKRDLHKLMSYIAEDEKEEEERKKCSCNNCNIF